MELSENELSRLWELYGQMQQVIGEQEAIQEEASEQEEQDAD